MSLCEPTCDPHFLALLAEFEVDELERDGGTVYGMWPDLTLAYVNRAWRHFASKNGGDPAVVSEWTLGRCVLDAIAEPLRPFFVSHYDRCLRELRPWEHVYECSSADVYRRFHMTVLPLGRAEGLLVVNSIRTEATITRIPLPPLDERYRSELGIITQCCHCRRVRRVGEQAAWDWVPDWVSRLPARTSHGICASCYGFYYGATQLELEHVVQPFSTIPS